MRDIGRDDKPGPPDNQFFMDGNGETTIFLKWFEQRQQNPVDMNHESSWLVNDGILIMAYETIPI